MDMFLGIDLGASSLKACLIAADGTVRALVRMPVDTHRPAPGLSEQRPQDWREALHGAMAALNARHGGDMAALQGACVSGGAHIAVLCDAEDTPLAPAIMWDDQRAHREAAALAEAGAVEAIAGNRPNATWTLPQLVHLQNSDPQLLATAEKLHFAKDWLRAQLTGCHTSDASEAVGGMLAGRDGRWSAELQQLSGLPAAAFAPLLAPTDTAGTVTAAAAAEFGLPAGLPVFQGAIDTSLEWLCAAPQTDDMASLKLASAGVLAFTTADPTPFPPVSHYPHVVPGLFYHAAGMSDCMGALDWARRTLTPQLDPQAFAAAARSAPAGADGLLFHPYLSGARAPFWDAALTAELTGLTRGHGQAAVARAAYEGVGHVLTAIWNDMTARLGRRPDRLHVLGGGAQEAFFCQMLADMLQVRLTAGAESDCALAAALLAATAGGAFKDLPEAAAAAYRPAAQFNPDSALAPRYGFGHENFMARHTG